MSTKSVFWFIFINDKVYFYDFLHSWYIRNQTPTHIYTSARLKTGNQSPIQRKSLTAPYKILSIIFPNIQANINIFKKFGIANLLCCITAIITIHNPTLNQTGTANDHALPLFHTGGKKDKNHARDDWTKNRLDTWSIHMRDHI